MNLKVKMLKSPKSNAGQIFAEPHQSYVSQRMANNQGQGNQVKLAINPKKNH